MNDRNDSNPAADSAAEDRRRLGRRRQLLSAVGLVVVVAAVAYGAYYAWRASRFEDTDNAYVQGNLVQITPQVGGTVLAIAADDTDLVHAGDPLVRLDPADARTELERSEAALGQAVRQVRTLFANNAALDAAIAGREADAARAHSDFDKARDDLSRRERLAASGAVSGEEIDHARTALAAARTQLAAAEAAVRAARGQLAANRAQTDGTTVARHPDVQEAAARVRTAYLALARVTLPAPVDGYVARRSAQVGQRVAAGTPLMAVVPLDALWVDANFKESQLAQMRIGQPVTLTADVYGGKTVYHGKVEGLGVGTGAAFSLLPAQNATGNWIKVVQRVPVRIALDPKELRQHPLRIGLSMEAEVNVSDTGGAMLAQSARHETALSTAVFDHQDDEADALVKRIIESNLDGKVVPDDTPDEAAQARPMKLTAAPRLSRGAVAHAGT